LHATVPVATQPHPAPPPGDADSARARAATYFRALDSLDADEVASFFAPGATVTLPRTPPILGRAAIRKALVQLSLAVDELRHQPIQLWNSGSLSVYEADLTLMLPNRTQLSFPVTHIVRWVEGMIQEARVDVYLESRVALAISAFDRLRQSSLFQP